MVSGLQVMIGSLGSCSDGERAFLFHCSPPWDDRVPSGTWKCEIDLCPARRPDDESTVPEDR